MEVVLRNVEILQVAIGEVHTLILDASVDPMKNPKGCGRMDVTNKKSRIKSFTNIEALKCKLTLRNKEGGIKSIAAFDANGKYYIITGSELEDEELWDLSNNKVIAKIPCHGYPVIFFKDGVQMVASRGSRLHEVDIWNLSSRTKIKTISDDGVYNSRFIITTLALYEIDDNLRLLAGCDCGTLLSWNMDTYEAEGIDDSSPPFISSVDVFYRNSNPYVVIGRQFAPEHMYYDPIEVWDLTRNKKIVNLDFSCETAFVSSVVML